jgi:hypothetical protein
LIIPIVRSIAQSRFPKAEIRVGGCGRKSMVEKQIRLPSTVKLLCDECEKAVELMIPMPKVPTVGAN